MGGTLAAANASLLRIAVASYTEPVGHSPKAHGDGVTVLELNVAARTARTLSVYGNIRNPGFLCAHPTRPILYVVSEVYDGLGTVSSVEYTPDFASVVRRSDLSCGGTVPSYVSLYDATTLLLSNYADEALLDTFGGGSVVAFAVTVHGHLESQLSILALSGRGPNPQRQRGPHAHCVLRHPRNGFVYAVDLGSDAVLQLRLDQGVLAPVSKVSVRPGSGPRHLAFVDGGAQALVVHELSNELDVIAIADDGTVADGTCLSLLPASATGHSQGADVAVTHDGQRAFASNRHHDTVVTFDRDDAGHWRAVAWTPTGEVPRSICLTPGDGHLIVGNQESDTVSVFAVRTDGGLSELIDFPVSTPTLVRVLP